MKASLPSSLGDVVWAEDGWATVLGVEDTGETQTVYNFEVDGYHTYFVGEAGVWAHNAGVPYTGSASVLKTCQRSNGKWNEKAD